MCLPNPNQLNISPMHGFEPTTFQHRPTTHSCCILNLVVVFCRLLEVGIKLKSLLAGWWWVNCQSPGFSSSKPPRFVEWIWNSHLLCSICIESQLKFKQINWTHTQSLFRVIWQGMHFWVRITFCRVWHGWWQCHQTRLLLLFQGQSWDNSILAPWTLHLSWFRASIGTRPNHFMPHFSSSPQPSESSPSSSTSRCSLSIHIKHSSTLHTGVIVLIIADKNNKTL